MKPHDFPANDHPVPESPEVLAERRRCAQIAVDVSRGKAARYKRQGAPVGMIAAAEAVGADIEHLILHPELEGLGVAVSGETKPSQAESAAAPNSLRILPGEE